MALLEMAIRHTRITGIDYAPGDSDGLTLNVTVSAGKIWLFRYYWTDKQKRMSLDCYPHISLQEARTRRDEVRAVVARGVNPYGHRRQQRRDRAYLRGRVRSVCGVPQAEPEGEPPEHALAPRCVSRSDRLPGIAGQSASTPRGSAS